MKLMNSALAAAVTVLIASSAFSQESYPTLAEAVASQTQQQPTYEYFSMLDGTPMDLQLHHDTEVGTGKRIDVYQLVIEKQTMNSDGMREPIGLQFGYLYTAKAVDPATAWNPNNAADCKTWVDLTVKGQETHQDGQPWPYIQFAAAKGARIIQTNEDGPVYWSDDIECWGALDRFAPF
jgi:hypothetical protein